MVKYNNKQYASALLLALQEGGENRRAEIGKKFLSVLRKHRASGRLNFILREVERQFLQKEKKRKVDLEFADEVPEGLEKELENILGGKIVLSEKRNPALVGGVKIVLDGETMVDASFRRQLDKIFK